MQDECPLGVAHHDLGLGRVGEKGDAAGGGQAAPEGAGAGFSRVSQLGGRRFYSVQPRRVTLIVEMPHVCGVNLSR